MAQAQVEGLALGVLPAPPDKGDGVLCTLWDARAVMVGEEEAEGAGDGPPVRDTVALVLGQGVEVLVALPPPPGREGEAEEDCDGVLEALTLALPCWLLGVKEAEGVACTVGMKEESMLKERLGVKVAQLEALGVREGSAVAVMALGVTCVDGVRVGECVRRGVREALLLAEKEGVLLLRAVDEGEGEMEREECMLPLGLELEDRLVVSVGERVAEVEGETEREAVGV